MALAYPAEACSKMGETIAKDHFLNSLNDRELAMKIAEKEVHDLDSAYRHALRIEASEKAFESQDARDVTARGRMNRTVHDDLQNRRVEYFDEGSGRFGGRRRPYNVRYIRDTERTIEELRCQVDQLCKERDELSKGLGRQQLLETQRIANASVGIAVQAPPSQEQIQQPLQQNCLQPAQQISMQNAQQMPMHESQGLAARPYFVPYSQRNPRPSNGTARHTVQCSNCRGLGYAARHC